MARLACWVAAGVLVLFAAAGNEIFKVMGITLPAFELAGSILLLRIALDMLYARRSPAQETNEEVEDTAGQLKRRQCKMCIRDRSLSQDCCSRCHRNY